ncbi:type I restriction-modification system subunit M [Oenococcus sicerae]|uniref:type I restriction-modification system subunit M n=1 Tax=Oenococcus sicerae TaxID=2203724 RepID=UPI0039E9BEF7
MESKNRASSLESSLWSAADVLRGKMDASEYKNYLLGLIFYRFLSEKVLSTFSVWAGIDHDIEKSYAQYLDPDFLLEDMAMRDDTVEYIEESLGYLIEPDALYSSLIEKIKNHQFALDDLAQALHDLENSTIGQRSAQDFAGLFADVDLSSNKLGNSLQQRNQAISDTMLALNNIDLTAHNGDVLGDAYEYLIAQFASDSGKKAGEFYTPRQVSDIIAQIVTYQRDQGDAQIKSVYDPAVGSGSLLLNVGQHVENSSLISYHGQELNTTTFNLARMNLMLHDVSYEDMHLNNGDTLAKDWPTDEPYLFDAVVMNPPYSAQWDNSDKRLSDPRFRDYGVLAPKSKADFAFLLHGFYHLQEQGTMGIVLPHGVLFRGAAEGKIRQKLLVDNRIDAIIGLPANIFHSTSIPTLIMILKKHKRTNDVLFIDASSDFEKGKNQNRLTEENIEKIINSYKKRQNVDKYAHVASMDEIKANDYNLNIPRYVDTFEAEPEIDLAQVKENLADIDQQIAETTAAFQALEAQLVSTGSQQEDQ